MAKRTAGRKAGSGKGRLFDPPTPTPLTRKEALLARAEKIAARYSVLVRPTKAGAWIAWSDELRGCLSEADTREECFRISCQNQAEVVAMILELGEEPPKPKLL